MNGQHYHILNQAVKAECGDLSLDAVLCRGVEFYFETLDAGGFTDVTDDSAVAWVTAQNFIHKDDEEDDSKRTKVPLTHKQVQTCLASLLRWYRDRPDDYEALKGQSLKNYTPTFPPKQRLLRPT